MSTTKVITSLAIVAALLAGPAAAQSPDAAEGDRVVFRVGMVNDIDSLNPFKALELPSYEVMNLQYNLLIEFSQEDLSPVPGIAESWESSADGLTWTYHLRDDVVFHDGEPLTSEDVKFTFDTVRENPGAAGAFVDYVQQIDTIKTPDDHTVVMTTKEPSVQMLSMYVPILPEHVWGDVSADELKSFPNEPSIGTGPFQAVEWDRGQSVHLVKSDTYFGEEPAIDDIYFQIYDNDDTMVQALKRGEVDYIFNPPTDLFLSLRGEPGIETVASPDPSFVELGLNVYEPTPESIDLGAPKESLGNPALLDARVRQAINWAVDEQEIVDRVLRGQAEAGSTLIPPNFTKWRLELEDDELMGFDLERARDLLADAGWEDTDDNGLVDKNGRDLELRLFARSEENATVRAAEFIEGWLEEIGIGVTTEAVSDNKLIEETYATDFDMFIWSWGSDPDPDSILSVLTCDQINNLSDSFWCNEEYDRLYELQKTQLDPDERAETVREMQRIAYEQSPYIVLYYRTLLEAYRSDRFTGWVRQPEGTGSSLFAYGAYTYLELEPAAGGADAAAGGGPTGLLVVGALLVAGIAVWLVLRRRASQDERA
ncbi:MAG: ABC transporter substrate-binding protein [Actinomycetota bacterium]|nr:ABC transporter substrate-binding protein [Actinomycetota bacterium]